ncbi:hypothetical protein WN943_000294 [Citrus x changshan-huyou]
MELLRPSLLLTVSLSLLQLVSAQTSTDSAEVDALNKLIDYWNLRSKINLTTIDPCTRNASWASENANPRVACDCTSNSCHITHLKIYALDIMGELPSELFMLRKLMDLNLGQNVLNGSIPAEIGQLSNMQYLSFSSNNFFGPLPKELGKLTSLQQLYIDSSGVTGSIPQEFANLKSLRILWASDNLFTGKIPEFFGTLTELADLRLQGTLLEGPIPRSFRALNKLEDLRIGDLSAEDSTLDFLESQKSLSILSLRNCRVSGKIPDQLGTFAKLQLLYLGNNNLSGELPVNIIAPNLIALDVSYNPLSGNLPRNFAKGGLSMNVIGSSINANNLQDGKALGMMQCLHSNTKCSNKVPSSSFSIKCGGTQIASASGIEFDDDSKTLEAASFYTSSGNRWAVSNTGNFISNPNGPLYIAQTDSQITGTLDSELYKTARISPSSLRYYGLGLENGKYRIDLHFAEITMEDSLSWKGLGRRVFDVYIQGERVLRDLNIKKEAGGSKRALVKTFEANVTNTIIEIHFFWAGKGTCCIPFQGTYGPLVSAIHASQVSTGNGSSKGDKKHVGKIVGITVGCAAALVIISSVFYLWWTKDSSSHIRIFTDSPKQNLHLRSPITMGLKPTISRSGGERLIH